MRRVLPVAALATAIALGAAGCAKRATAYRFRSPLVGTISAPDVPARDYRSSSETRTARTVREDRELASPTRRRAQDRSTAITRPKKSRPPKRPPPSPTAARLLAFVGERDKAATDAGFAVRAVESLGVSFRPEVKAAADRDALVAAAKARDGLAARGPLLGDLVVFDRAVGVVTRVLETGTVEFVYLSMGIVRRGYLNQKYPTDKRDHHGRILNTFVRDKRGHDRGKLAGTIFVSYIRLDRLTL